jgi:cytochrome c oxidase subunit 4
METTQGLGRIGDGHEEPHAHTEALPHHKVPYFLVFGTLVVLTVVTVAVAFLDIHNELVKVLLALTIASIKASAVALFFMHLKFEGKLIYLILIVPLLLCILLVCALIPDIVHSTPFNPLTPLPGASGH